MYVCSCNPFNDKAVKQYLTECGEQKARCGDVYRACSGGASPNCGRCGPTLKEMVREHNNALTVNQMKENFPASTDAEEEREDAAPAATPVNAKKPDQPVI
jgi:bacterioferritin-associated ferredoxin